MPTDCYECTGYGDDYYLDENGEWKCACDDCPLNQANEVTDNDTGRTD